MWWENILFLYAYFLTLTIGVIFSISFLLNPSYGIILSSLFLTTKFLQMRNLIEILYIIGYILYYMLLLLVYFILGVFIIRKSFNNVEKIIEMKNEAHLKDLLLRNTLLLMYNLLLNSFFFAFSIIVCFYTFNFVVIKIPLVLYCSWSLGFLACFPLKENITNENSINTIKDYVLVKALINTLIFVFIYYFIIEYLINQYYN